MRRRIVVMFAGLAVLGAMVSQAEAAGKRKKGRGYARQQIKRMERLEELMSDRLDLSRDQEVILEGAFEEHVDALKDLAKDADTRREDQKEELEALEDAMREAREAKDRERMREVAMEITEIRQIDRTEVDELNTDFYDSVREELTEDQVKGFNRLIREIKKRKRPDSIRNRYRKTAEMNVLLKEKCDLTPDQQKAVNQHMMDFMREMMDVDGDDEEEVVAMQNELREAILSELSTDQRRQFTEAEDQTGEEPDEERK